MANDVLLPKESSSSYLFSAAGSLDTLLPIAINEGSDNISIFLTGVDKQLTCRHPKSLKDELNSKVTDSKHIDSLSMTRAGRIYISTKSVTTAQELLAITTILNTSVKAYIETETVTTKFLLRLDETITCEEIAEELKEQGYVVYEIRRFMRKGSETPLPTQTVLVTLLGTSLPPEVKLWYQNYRIQMFFDRPRQCAKCYGYTHATKTCRSDQEFCKKCAKSHSGNCETNTLVCKNCNGPHMADDKTCPAYIHENNLQRFRGEHHLTLRQARRQFKSYQTNNNTSYSAITASGTQESFKKADFEILFDQLALQIKDMVKNILQEFMQGFIAAFPGLAGCAPLSDLTARVPPTSTPSVTPVREKEDAQTPDTVSKKPRLSPSNTSEMEIPMETNAGRPGSPVKTNKPTRGKCRGAGRGGGGS